MPCAFRLCLSLPAARARKKPDALSVRLFDETYGYLIG